MLNSFEVLSTLFVFLIIIIIFWLLIRELVCWYYKINERISLQRQNNELLEKILKALNQSNGIQSDLVNVENENIDFEVSSNDTYDVSYANAKSLASKYNEGGKTDWRLPTYDELKYVYENKNKYPFLKNDKYWSCDEKLNSGVIVVDLLKCVDDVYRESNSFRAFFVRGKIN